MAGDDGSRARVADAGANAGGRSSGSRRTTTTTSARNAVVNGRLTCHLPCPSRAFGCPVAAPRAPDSDGRSPDAVYSDDDLLQRVFRLVETLRPSRRPSPAAAMRRGSRQPSTETTGQRTFCLTGPRLSRRRGPSRRHRRRAPIQIVGGAPDACSVADLASRGGCSRGCGSANAPPGVEEARRPHGRRASPRAGDPSDRRPGLGRNEQQDDDRDQREEDRQDDPE